MPAWVRAAYGRRRARFAEVVTSSDTEPRCSRSVNRDADAAQDRLSLLAGFGARTWPIQAGYSFIAFAFMVRLWHCGTMPRA